MAEVWTLELDEAMLRALLMTLLYILDAANTRQFLDDQAMQRLLAPLVSVDPAKQGKGPPPSQAQPSMMAASQPPQQQEPLWEAAGAEEHVAAAAQRELHAQPLLDAGPTRRARALPQDERPAAQALVRTFLAARRRPMRVDAHPADDVGLWRVDALTLIFSLSSTPNAISKKWNTVLINYCAN